MIATDHGFDAEYPSASFSNLSFEVFGGNRSAFGRRAIAIALRQSVDLLLIGHINYAPLGMMLKSLRPSLRYGVMVHGVEAWVRLPLLKRLALQHADFITAVSKFTRTKVAELNGLKRDRIRIVPNTIEWSINAEAEKSASVARAFGICSKSTLLLSVCRLEATEKYKGVDTVIAALPSVIARVPNVAYVVIGSGSDLERHKQLAANVGITDRVHFLGSVDDVTLRHFYQGCDLFVLPSDGEGFGIVYLEAMHHGKAVIAANSRAVPEVVKHNESGLLVEYGDAAQLAESIISLCLNQSIRERMGNAGRERLREKFSFESFKRRLHELILQELQIPRPSAQRTIARGVASADL